MKLVERGEIDLDRPLSEILPHPDLDDPRRDLLTARQVLTHTTGLPNWRPGRWSDDPGPLVLGFDPGARFSYSGEGFEYLQKVVEHLRSSGLEEIATREVFEPLGMSHSSFYSAPSLQAAQPHDFLGETGEKRQFAEASAAGSLHTTAGDYGRFVAEVLRPRHLGADRALAMLSPQVEVEDGVSWGLGWGLEQDAGTLWHWGDNGDFRCFVMASRERREGLVLFTNSNNGLAIAAATFEELLGTGHPAFAWIDHDRHDSPGFQIRDRLLRAGIDGGTQEITATFTELEEIHGEDLAENLVNGIGYALLDRDRTEAAVAVFGWNVGKFPESWNVYDSFAEALAKNGEKDSAILNYEKSLELNPENENTKTMLVELREVLGTGE
jgi:CubicO group peptidase (beta-lactamase class C family)